MTKIMQITQIKSRIGALEAQKATLKALGLRRIGHAKTYSDSASLRGMINAIRHLVKVEEVKEGGSK